MHPNPHALERRFSPRAEPNSAEFREATHTGVAGLGLARRTTRHIDDEENGEPEELAVEPNRGGSLVDHSIASSSALASYLRTLSKIPELSETEESELAYRSKLGDAVAREALIRANLAAVVRIARRYVNLGLPLMDLIGEGNLGLMLAVDRYNPVTGTRFIAYASFWIRRQIRLALSNQSRTIRLPMHRQNDLRAINAAAAALHGVLGREASVEEIAVATSLRVTKVRAVLGAIPKLISVDAPPASDETSSLADSLCDESASDPAESLTLREATDTSGLDDAVNRLKPRDRDVICARFGLAGGPTMTLVQLARRMNLTCEGVRQIQSRALTRLRREMRLQRLKEAVFSSLDESRKRRQS